MTTRQAAVEVEMICSSVVVFFCQLPRNFVPTFLKENNSQKKQTKRGEEVCQSGVGDVGHATLSCKLMNDRTSGLDNSAASSEVLS